MAVSIKWNWCISMSLGLGVGTWPFLRVVGSCTAPLKRFGVDTRQV